MMYADHEYSLLGKRRTVRIRRALNKSESLKDRIKTYVVTREALLQLNYSKYKMPQKIVDLIDAYRKK
jgi:hypothetical protein